MGNKVVLIDGDIIVCRAAGAAQHMTYFCCVNYANRIHDEKYPISGTLYHHIKKKNLEADQLKTCLTLALGLNFTPDAIVTVEKGLEVEPVSYACHNAGKMIDSLLNKFQEPDMTIRVFLGSPNTTNPRKAIATSKPYKEKRKKPVLYLDVLNYMMRRFPLDIIEDQEVDDAINQAALAIPDSSDRIIVSIDKDLKQIPGWHYDFTKNVAVGVTDEMASRNFWTQMLVGDTVDTVPGLRGYGPAKAKKVLEGLTLWAEMRFAVQQEYFKALQTRDPTKTFDDVMTYYIEQYKLLKLMPYEPLDMVYWCSFTKGERQHVD